MKTGDAPRLYQWLGLNTQGDIGPYTMYTAKDKGLVIYLQAPPKEPASRRQVHNRNRWRLMARQWHRLTAAARQAWQLAAMRAHLRISGWNLWCYMVLRHDLAAIRTIEGQSHITLDKSATPL